MLTTNNNSIRYAEAAYAAAIDRHLHTICDYEEPNLPKEYAYFERYIEEHRIEIHSMPFQNDFIFYIDGDSKKLQELAEELEAYFLADDTISKAYIADDGTEGESLFFIEFKTDTIFIDAEKRLIDGYGYVAFCCDQNIEIETDLPF